MKESLKSVNDERLLRIFPPENRFFSLETVKKCMKKRPHRHTQKRDQHHKNYATSIIMFASSFNAVRSSPSIISKNVSSKSSRSSSRSSSTVKVRAMGMKKGSLLFSFSSSRVVIHLISTRRFQKWLCFFLFSSFDEDDETITMNKDRYRSVHAEYDERNDAGRSDRDDRQQQRLFSSSLICFCLSAPFFRIYNRSRLKHLSKNAAEKTT